MSIHKPLTQEEKEDLARYVHYVYVEHRDETWHTMEDINNAVEKYSEEIVERNDPNYSYGGTDTLDRERVHIFLN